MKELNTIQVELNAPKNQTNSFGGYKYRSCEDILEALKPLLKKTGCTLTINDEITLIGDRFFLKATATIKNDKGEMEQATAFAELDHHKGMSNEQSTGSSSSYARKYALNALFCIDDNKDADATNTHDKETKPAPAPAPKSQDDLKNALAEADKCATQEALMNVWNKYKSLQKDKTFVAKLSEVKARLAK